MVIIDRNLDVRKSVDHGIDLGPEGGNGVGTVVCVGTPEQVAKCEISYTGKFLTKLV
jgi:excinuclease ABC subunit A